MTAGVLKLPAAREAVGKQYPLGGIQTAQAVASVMDWLLSPDAARLTGQKLAVEGCFYYHQAVGQVILKKASIFLL